MNKVFLLMLCLGVTAVMLAGLLSGTAKEAVAASQSHTSAKGEHLDALPLDAPTQLIALGKQATVPGSALRMVLKWQGEISVGSEHSAKAAQELAFAMGLGKVSGAEEDGHVTYRAEAKRNDQVKISMFWSELDGETSYVIVTFETADALKAGEWQSDAEEAGRIMRSNGIAAEWNMTVQGKANAQGTPREVLAHTEQDMLGAFSSVVPVERYEDDTTSSRSYTVPGVKRSVESGDHAISMQAAVHRDSNDGSKRVTIGLPLITVEY
ncbi:YwmB family TATA-box binding protein [Paenibacillus sp. sgz500958]|uniref:YwmB family TATA-box binding protein n=1 Tax=Paenibacillus sp. sgz500958 TaxID=3242475 RepID=UPI0036D32ECC